MGTEQKTEDYSLTSFDYVIVEKERLLKTLRENRENHDEIYKAACQGYWLKCGDVLKERHTQFSEEVKGYQKRFEEKYNMVSAAVEAKDRDVNLTLWLGDARGNNGFNFDYNLGLAHPSNHLADYDRAISMLEFSVADKVRLTAQHFNAYVRNDWEWKDSFASTNLGYIKHVTGSLFANVMALSGIAIASGTAVHKFALNNGR